MLTLSTPRKWIYLLPLLTFLLLYVGIGICLSLNGHDNAFSQFPAASCALAGLAVALILGYKDINAQLKTIITGIGNETVILMCLIFLLAGAFSAVTQSMGGVNATVNMGLHFLPSKLLLPGLFLIACFISFSMGTSMGTISTIVPIAIGIASKTGLDLSLTIGAVIGGSMFGDNLSIISDTTIAATSTQGCDMRSKMHANLKIAIPAAVATTILLFFLNESTTTSMQEFDFSFIKTLPYLAVFILALAGINVIAVLMIGIGLAALIGLTTNSFDFIILGKSIYDGFLSMSEVFYLTFIISGLAAIAIQNGGLQFLLDRLKILIKNKRSAEIGIASFISFADVCIANNTIAILVTGDMVKHIAQHYKISAARAASIIDIFSCVWQGLIPYGAQLLLAGALANLSPFQIIPAIWYPMILGFFAILTIIFQWPKSNAITNS